MASYEPVDLSAACNAGVEVLGDEPGDLPLGRVNLRGLPFLIGPEPPSAERCFLLPGGPMTAGIGRVARRVIVAHRLLDPGGPAGHGVGQAVAEYAFHLAGGEVVVVPIRERFEIQVVPPAWGRQRFLAVPDTSDGNQPLDGNAWIACRAFGADYHLDEWGRQVFAHTSPVYVACGGEWTMADPEGIRYIRTLARVPANTYGTRPSAGPTSSRRTITARLTTSPGWSGRSPRPCARCTIAAVGERHRPQPGAW
jgi:hypothetical protein